MLFFSATAKDKKKYLDAPPLSVKKKTKTKTKA